MKYCVVIFIVQKRDIRYLNCVGMFLNVILFFFSAFTLSCSVRV